MFKSNKNVDYNSKQAVFQQSEQYEEEQSQPLIQQVDKTYEPTQRQVRDYAIEALGMILPADNDLLYIAREGLKAPLPPNWLPYQSRQGQVYYKHKKTQQKIYDHPTDIEYRKKFQEKKEIMARKNINKKQLPNSNNFNQIGSSGLDYHLPSVLLEKSFKLDPGIEEQYERQLQQLAQKLKKQWKQFEIESNKTHQRKINNYKQNYERSIKQIQKQIFKNDEILSKQEYILKQKQRIKQRIQQNEIQQLKEYLNNFNKDQNKKIQQYNIIYNEDNQYQIKKYQNQKKQQYQIKENLLNKEIQLEKEMNRKQEKERKQKLMNIQKEFNDPNNNEINRISKQLKSEQLRNIIQYYQNKKIEKEKQIENNLYEIRKILGLDQSHNINQLGQKKRKIKEINEEKIKSYKKKQIQIVNQKTQEQYNKLANEIIENNTIDLQLQLDSYKRKINSKIEKTKKQIDQEYKNKLQKTLEIIYQQNIKRINQYQINKNKKLIHIRQNYINIIKNKNNYIEQQINKKIQIKEKQKQIYQKQYLIKNLKKQKQLEIIILKQMFIIKELNDSKNIDFSLKKIIQDMNIKYKPQIYLERKQQYIKLQQKYHKDKQLLTSLMQNLQQQTMIGYQHKKSIHKYHYTEQQDKLIEFSQGNIVKQYNQDIRIMRQNQTMLFKMEITLKKAAINDQQAIELLEEQNNFQYKNIGIYNSLENKNKLQTFEQITNQKYNNTNKNINSIYNNHNMQQTLQKHSRFLYDVKNDLNKKLFSIRNNYNNSNCHNYY